MANILLIVLALALVLLNGFFVAAEFAMVKLRHTRVQVIKRQHGMRGAILAKIHSDLDSYLSACQLGITIASLGLGWVGEPAFAYLLQDALIAMGIVSVEVVRIIAFIVAFLFISYLHIVIGELAPKSMAIRQSERLSLWTAIPLYGFYWLMYPAIWLLNASANRFLKITRFSRLSKSDHMYGAEELRLILDNSHLGGKYPKYEAEILENTLDLVDLHVSDIMRPIEELVSIDIALPISRVLQAISEHRYSRYPIYKGENQDIIGIVHVKDLFAASMQQKQITDLKPFVRTIFTCGHKWPVIKLLRQMRKNGSHFASVNRYGRYIGFVTMDTITSVLLGRIRDEFNKTRRDWTRTTDGGILIRGNASVYALECALDMDITTSENVSTITGLLFEHLGRMPVVGERIAFSGFDLVIDKIKGSHIVQVRAYKTNPLVNENRSSD